MRFTAATIVATVFAALPFLASAQTITYSDATAPTGGSFDATVGFSLTDATVAECQTQCSADARCTTIIFRPDNQCDSLVASTTEIYVVPAGSTIYRKMITPGEVPAPPGASQALRMRRRGLAFHANRLEEAQW